MGAIMDVYADAGAGAGWLCGREIDGCGVEEFDAHEFVPAASVYKIAVALELLRQAHGDRPDLREPVVLTPARATPRPIGFSAFEDEVEASLPDLAWMMMTISDNTASDALSERVGPESVHANLRSLGVQQTVIRRPARRIRGGGARGGILQLDRTHPDPEP